MTLTPEQQARLRVKGWVCLWSDVLEEFVVLSNGLRLPTPIELPRTRCYEIQVYYPGELAALPRDPTALRRCHEIKQLFGGRFVTAKAIQLKEEKHP